MHPKITQTIRDTIGNKYCISKQIRSVGPLGNNITFYIVTNEVF